MILDIGYYDLFLTGADFSTLFEFLQISSYCSYAYTNTAGNVLILCPDDQLSILCIFPMFLIIAGKIIPDPVYPLEII